jgi:hypothetical protein
MMLDRDEARLWADHHGEFTRWASRIVRETAEAFQVLARLRYDQPWRRTGQKDGCG